ncbi:MAG: tetratricopeptide repeat protein [Chloroherpetonaceae bacterium]|nr:tetratricopeptide repeat protein [Chloroherpetonaceae bacterium]
MNLYSHLLLMRSQRVYFSVLIFFIYTFTPLFAQESLETKLQTGKLLLDRNAFQEAIQVYSETLLRDSSVVEAYLKRGFAKQRIMDSLGALEDFNQAIRLKPESADGYFYRGVFYLERASYFASLADFVRASKHQPNNPNIWYYQGFLNALIGDHSIAIENFKKTISLSPDFTGVYFELGLSLLKLLQYDEAYVAFETANQKKTDAENYLYLGLICYGQKRYEESIQNISEAIRLKRRDVYFYHRAMSKIRLKKIFSALPDLDSAIILNPRYAVAYFYRGSVKIEMKLINEACKDFVESRLLGYVAAETLLDEYCSSEGNPIVSNSSSSSSTNELKDGEYIVRADPAAFQEAVAISKKITKLGFNVVSNASIALTNGNIGLARSRQAESVLITPDLCNSFMLNTMRSGQITLACLNYILKQQALVMRDSTVSEISLEINQRVQEFEYMGIGTGQDSNFARRRELLGEINSFLLRLDGYLKKLNTISGSGAVPKK